MSIFEILSSLELGLIYGIVAMGICLTFRVIDFPDLTCDGSFVLGAAVAAMLLQAGYNPVVAILLAALMGGLVGFGTWALHTYFKISNLLSGILMAFMLYSINLKIMRGVPNIALINLPTVFDGYNTLLILLLFSVALWLGVSFLLSTDFGLALRSIGQNKRLAINTGVRISTMTLLALVLSNATIALAGGLFSQHQGFADVSQGVGTVIIGLAAVMIGEKLLPTRSVWLTLLACLVGSVIYRLVVALALHSDWLGLETQDLNLITGVFVAIIMFMPAVGLRNSGLPNKWWRKKYA